MISEYQIFSPQKSSLVMIKLFLYLTLPILLSQSLPSHVYFISICANILIRFLSKFSTFIVLLLNLAHLILLFTIFYFLIQIVNLSTYPSQLTKVDNFHPIYSR